MLLDKIPSHLATAGHSAPSADNAQPWHFTWDGAQLLTEYDTTRVAATTFPPDSPAVLLSLGAVIENFTLTAEHGEFELGSQFTADDGSVKPSVTTQFSGGGPASNSLLDNPAAQRHTNRKAYKRTALPSAVVAALTATRRGSAGAICFQAPGDIKTLATLSQSAGQIRFQTQEVHEWLAASLRFTTEEVNRGDGMDVRTLDLPPGGAQFLQFTSDWRRMAMLNKIGAHRFMAMVDSAPLKAAPALVAILGPATRAGAIDAGRLLSRTWTSLNGQGIAVHPYYVIADQLIRLAEKKIPQQLIESAQELKHSTDHFFGLTPGTRLYMLLRVGYPVHEVLRSRRLPIHRVFADLTQSGQCSGE
tara:strand:+ start:70550 stop:71632 length:1083 start_codon:yes stop_codon:yes gene_type:complete